ncbi:hypothetical protein Tco_0396641, partial [Tanacetum coccineum]
LASAAICVKMGVLFCASSDMCSSKGEWYFRCGNQKKVEVEIAKVLKEKRRVKPFSNFYDRRIKISKPLSEEEKKLVEYIWSDSCPEG